MSTPAERIAVDLRNAYEWRDRESLENAIKRMLDRCQTCEKCAENTQKRDGNERKRDD
jgi:recombinational DNA repair protein RecR